MLSKLKKYCLPTSFYTHADVNGIAKELLGKYLYTHINGQITGGIIVETEAYCGASDKACHAFQNKRTQRTATMFEKGGIAYVYLCYGIHALFNVVSNVKDQADAILIRAIEPSSGKELMLKRRGMDKVAKRLTAGPGCLSKALGIEVAMNGKSLTGETFWITHTDIETDLASKTIEEKQIISSPRVGVEYAGEDALLPWRYRIDGNKWTSPAK